MKCDSGRRSHAVLSDKPSPPRQSESNSLSGAGNSIHLVIKLSFFFFLFLELFSKICLPINFLLCQEGPVTSMRYVSMWRHFL